MTSGYPKFESVEDKWGSPDRKGEQSGEPERRIESVLKSMVLGRRRVILGVIRLLPMIEYEFIPEPRIPNGMVSAAQTDRRTLEQFARAHTRSDQLVVLGFLNGDSSHQLYKFPNNGIANVMQLFDVGNRIGGMDPELDSLNEQISKIESGIELLPFFADPAGIKLKIPLPLDRKMRELIDQTIIHPSAEPMLDDDGFVSGTIATTGCLQFWWS